MLSWIIIWFAAWWAFGSITLTIAKWPGLHRYTWEDLFWDIMLGPIAYFLLLLMAMGEVMDRPFWKKPILPSHRSPKDWHE